MPVDYKELKQAQEMRWSFLAQKALADPIWGTAISRLVSDHLMRDLYHNEKADRVRAQGKDPHRNKEVALRWQRSHGSKESALIVIEEWLRYRTDLMLDDVDQPKAFKVFANLKELVRVA